MLPGTTLLKQRDIQIIECLCIPRSYQAMESSSGISSTRFLAGIQSSACPLQTAWAFANLSNARRQTSMAHDSFGREPNVQLNSLICFYCRGKQSSPFSPIQLNLHVKVLLWYKGMCILSTLPFCFYTFLGSTVQVMILSVALF